MSKSFSSMKKNRASRADKLKEKLKNGGGRNKDPRFWTPTFTKKGTARATIRVLPAPQGEDDPFVRSFTHGFKGKTGKWYIEKSLTMIGQKDPVSEINSELWNTNTQKNQDLARSRKRRLKFITNILVIDDKGNPENNGKVFLYECGVKIMNLLEAALDPEYEDDEPFDPFDFWEGANVELKLKKVKLGKNWVPNYDDCTLDEPSALFDGDDEKLEALWKKQYSLQEFLDPSKFESYETLKKKLKDVLGDEAERYSIFDSDGPGGSINAEEEEEDDIPSGNSLDADDEPEEEEETPRAEDHSDPDGEEEEDGDDDDDDALDFFNSLAEEDED